MAKLSPLQEVKERFGSKADLAKALYDKLETVYVDESREDFERRIRTTSNAKLLRLYKNTEELESRFSSKDGLVDAIMKLRTGDGKPDTQYRERIARYQVGRLLDMHRTLERQAARA